MGVKFAKPMSMAPVFPQGSFLPSLPATPTASGGDMPASGDDDVQTSSWDDIQTRGLKLGALKPATGDSNDETWTGEHISIAGLYCDFKYMLGTSQYFIVAVAGQTDKSGSIDFSVQRDGGSTVCRLLDQAVVANEDWDGGPNVTGFQLGIGGDDCQLVKDTQYNLVIEAKTNGVQYDEQTIPFIPE